MLHDKILLNFLTVDRETFNFKRKMKFYQIFEFLRNLQNNNSKEWMDAHRSEYQEVRDSFIDWLEQINIKLGALDSDYHHTPGKKAINRINNNLMYHPNKPIYKDHFGAGLDQVSKQGDFYIHLGTSETFIGGGYWHPSSKILKSIRGAIDYNGDDFKNIINKNSFRNMFGGLVEDDSLKTAPKGYSHDHDHIELLRRKSFAIRHDFTQKEVQKDDFEQKIIAVYKEMLPFRRYLNKAVTV